MTRALRLIITPAHVGVHTTSRHTDNVGENISQHMPGFLIARTYSRRSQHQRTSIIRRFILDCGDPTPEQIDARTVLSWWGRLADRAPATRQAHLSGVRQFLEHLRALGHTVIDIAPLIKRPRAPRKPPVVLTETEILRFLAWLPTPRDRAVGALMLGCGLRASDVTAVQVEAINLDHRLLTVTGKGDKTRLVPIPTATIVCVELYLGGRTSGLLVQSFRTGRPVSADHVQQRMTRLLWDAGVKRSAFDGRSSHVLRRTCATTLLESGATVRDVQEILGHESLATTHAYLAVPEARRLVALIDAGPMPPPVLSTAA